uniref:Programmed cell death 2 n=1 Tax=Pelodiscus sinensis TaxID=13735 RepID=K7G479_PELSI
AAARMGSPVELGFVEQAAPWRLRSAQSPRGLPSAAGLRPLRAASCLRTALTGGRGRRPGAVSRSYRAAQSSDPDRPSAPFGHCPAAPFTPAFPPVFRSQLPRENDTYSYDPPPDAPPPEGQTRVSLQLQCGAHLCRAKVCSKCHRAHYCSKEHQTVDWKSGHKLSCAQSAQLDAVIPDHKFLFPEYEIVIEPEEMETPGDGQTDEDSESEGFESLDEEVLEAMAKHETQEDKIFQKFKNRIAAEPEQILRYCRGREGPIWISGENIPQMKEIPHCSCGAQRIFEFQVMPQLLTHLKVDSLGESIDWGTLVVYTCAENCNLANGYMEEFIWKQDITTDST